MLVSRKKSSQWLDGAGTSTKLAGEARKRLGLVWGSQGVICTFISAMSRLVASERNSKAWLANR